MMKRKINYVKQPKNTRPKVKTKKKTDDKEHVLNRVKRDATYIRYASDRLKDDKEVVMAAMNSAYSYQEIFKHISKRLQSQLSVIIKGVSTDKSIYKSLPKNTRFKKQVTLAAVSKNGDSLRFTSNELKDNYQVVKAAIINAGHSIKYASKRLKDNKKLALLAVSTSSGGLSSELLYVSSRLKYDREVCLEAVKNEGHAIRHVPEDLKLDPEIAHFALAYRPSNARFFHPQTLLDLDFSNLSIFSSLTKANRNEIFTYFQRSLDIKDDFVREIILSYGKERILKGLDLALDDLNLKENLKKRRRSLYLQRYQI